MPAAETKQAGQGRTAGLLPAGCTILLAAVLSWVWLLPTLSAPPDPDRDGAARVGILAKVAPHDIADALKTMSGSAAFLSSFKQGTKRCARRLAWVSIARVRGQPAAPLRLKSGLYLSPVFVAGDTPLRIAIPYPAPYGTGHGTIDVMGTGSVVVALRPPWRVTFQSHAAPAHANVHAVQWIPAQSCQGSE